MSRRFDPTLPRKIYVWIVQQILQGRSPTIREIGEAFAIQSTGHISFILKKLVDLGLIRIESRELSRGICLTRTAGVPLLGTIAAGLPLDIPDRQTFIPEEFMPIQHQGPDIFALRVQGSSMIEDGILEGDYVIIHAQATCEQGEMIVATNLHNSEYGGATLKRFYREKDQVRLQPANAAMVPITIPLDVWEHDWIIQGKVIAIQRLLE